MTHGHQKPFLHVCTNRTLGQFGSSGKGPAPRCGIASPPGATSPTRCHALRSRGSVVRATVGRFAPSVVVSRRRIARVSRGRWRHANGSWNVAGKRLVGVPSNNAGLRTVDLRYAVGPDPRFGSSRFPRRGADSRVAERVRDASPSANGEEDARASAARASPPRTRLRGFAFSLAARGDPAPRTAVDETSPTSPVSSHIHAERGARDVPCVGNECRTRGCGGCDRSRRRRRPVRRRRRRRPQDAGLANRQERG